MGDCVTFPTVDVPLLNKLTAHQSLELWSLRLGSPGSRQLEKITKHATGLPAKLHMHKFRLLDEVSNANIKKEPAGTSDCEATHFGKRFHMDLSFMRASSEEYRKVKGKSRVICLRQGFTAVLIIIDRKIHRIFAFPTLGKTPPVQLVDAFLTQYGLSGTRLRAICTDQGGELAWSTTFQ